MNKEIEKENVNGFCPYCLKEISVIWVCKLESIIGIRYVYFCGECQKSLGTFQNRIKNFGRLFSHPIQPGRGAKNQLS
jgi:hypothetical protein